MNEKNIKELQHYSLEFKRTVIEEYLRTGDSKLSLQKKFDIKIKSGINRWMRQLGYEDIHQKPGYLTTTIIPPLATKKPLTNEPGSNHELEKRIKELERLLEDEQLRSEAYERIIDIAEKEFHIPIRKKPNTK
jgi:transposase-like protein